jgi:hypothetical protein
MAQERAPLRLFDWRSNGAAMLFSTGNFPRGGRTSTSLVIEV